MSPVDVIQSILKVNKPAGVTLLIGMGVFAAASIVIGWGGQPKDELIVGAYILGGAVAVTVVATVVTQPTMKLVLGWLIVAAIILFVIGLVDSAMGFTGRLPSPACYLRLLVVDPDTCERQLFPAVPLNDFKESPTVGWIKREQTGKMQFAQNQPSEQVQERLWLAQVAESDIAALGLPQAPNDFEGRIYMRYGPGQDQQDEALRVILDLSNLGWRTDGGEFTEVSETPEKTEIWFYADDNRAGVFALATAVQALHKDSQVVLRDLSQAGYFWTHNRIEIWLAK